MCIFCICSFANGFVCGILVLIASFNVRYFSIPVDVFQNHLTMSDIDLKDNGIGPTSMNYFKHMLKENKRLTELVIVEKLLSLSSTVVSFVYIMFVNGHCNITLCL